MDKPASSQDPKGNPKPPAKPAPKASPSAADRPAPKPAANKPAPNKPAAANKPGAKPLPKARQDGAKPAAKSPKPLPAGQQAANQPVNEKGRRVGKAVGVREELEELAEEGGFMLAMREWLKQTPSWLTSMVVHAVVLLILAILVVREQTKTAPSLVAEKIEEENLEEIPPEDFQPPEELSQDLNNAVEVVSSEADLDGDTISTIDDNAAAAVDVEFNDMSDIKAIAGNLTDAIGAYEGGDLDGRGNPASRAAAVARYGGTKQSEEAVAKALKWIAEHQLPDGSWSFDHRPGKCNGRCANPGGLKDARNAATGMALLPFLGAGQTHMQGEYKATVKRGLYYLLSQMKPTGALNEPGGAMYAHGICSIALCEAYAMTQDKGLKRPAQASINFIVSAQDKVGGGWRYTPGQPGDTSVVGWQLMALKSGHMAYLAIPPATIKGATNFLNSVQSDSGAQYGYTAPGGGAARTAIGLLCRMYMGWKRDHGALERGVEYLSKTGPSKNNMYYNYYATQVMHHFEGPLWKKWNEEMREYLIATQDQNGHEEGSWFLNGGHGAERGGRLYTTAMCAMTLEVYYRHLPIYRKQAADEEFDE